MATASPLGTIDNPIPRRASRIIVVDATGRVLMLRGFDPATPSIRYWFTAGGGLEDGEDAAAGAARELREETGLVVAQQALGEPIWHQTTEFPFDGNWYRQEQDFFVVRVGAVEVSLDGLDAQERRSIDHYRWWSIAELMSTGERFYPEALPGLLRGILDA